MKRELSSDAQVAIDLLLRTPGLWGELQDANLVSFNERPGAIRMDDRGLPFSVSMVPIPGSATRWRGRESLTKYNFEGVNLFEGEKHEVFSWMVRLLEENGFRVMPHLPDPNFEPGLENVPPGLKLEAVEPDDDFYTMEEFIQSCKHDLFTSDDGGGVYACTPESISPLLRHLGAHLSKTAPGWKTNQRLSTVAAAQGEVSPLWSHVVWYNK